MAATQQALRLTDAYRVRLDALVRTASREARQQFQDLDLDAIDRSYAPIRVRVSGSVSMAQIEAVRLTAGYLGAYLSAELGSSVAPPAVGLNTYVGKSYGGLLLLDSLDSPRIAMLTAIRDGQPDPRGTGLRVLLQNVDLDVKAAARAVLHDQIESDPRIEGWERAIRGTCAACAGAADGAKDPGEPLNIHPHCQCVAEPRVSKGPGIPITSVRITGQEMFDRLDSNHQDEMIGAAAAEMIRNEEATLADFIEVAAPGDAPGFLRQKPVEDV